MSAPSSHPAPSHLINRRRSISRSSKSSIGGKPIPGPRYGSLRRGSVTNSSDPSNTNESAISLSDSEDGLAKLIGSYSATREELRDGSARLASLSLSSPQGIASPPIHSAPAASPLALKSPPSDPAASAAGTSPSNLSLARPAHLSKTLADRRVASGDTPESTSSSLSPIAAGASPSESLNELTPTQSNIGDLPAASSTPPIGTSTGSDERTPTPQRMLTQERVKLERAKAEERERYKEREREQSRDRKEGRILGDETGGRDREEEEEDMLARQMILEEEEDEEGEGSETAEDALRRHATSPRSPLSERTPLLGAVSRHARRVSQSSFVGGAKKRFGGLVAKGKAKVHALGKEDVKDFGSTAVKSVPAVILGTLMNILDGVSYGLITFPTQVPAFQDFGGIGVSLFFISCIVAQVTFSGGGSIFRGGNGSMMIEVVPFYHAIVSVLQANISDDRTLVATTMFAFAMSSVLTGLAFGLLGLMKLGRLSEFFPRHILVGTIGGVGAFLFVTGLTVSARMEEDSGISLELIQHFFDMDILPLWTIPLALAILLRLITHRYSHPLIFPGYFMLIPAIFYIITLSAGISVEDLRKKGWVFEISGVDNGPFEYLSHFDLKHTDFGAIIETIPTQLALVFFGLLHVPYALSFQSLIRWGSSAYLSLPHNRINVPSLAISVGEDNVDTNRELVAHGVSNVASGLIGSVPNYLVYVNSVLFYEVGGTTRLSGFLLALGSLGVLLAGPGVIGYLPVCVVAALIFILGIDLVKEAVWDTWGRVSAGEYCTILAIVLTMTIFDFVWGLAAGLVLASVHFVILSSQRRAIRTIISGSVARSTVRRHPKQSAFLQEVGRQIRVVKLQGFLFFGTISNVEATVRKLLDSASWTHNPIRFLVVDFSMASGVDFSAAEAFVRMQRLLDERGVVLVLCGCSAESAVGTALRSVDLWSDSADSKVVVLENMNDALEHCENAFLRSLYSKTLQPLITPQASQTSGYHGMTSQIDMPKADIENDLEGFAGSPRAAHLRTAARETISRPETPQSKLNFQQPLPILLQAFQPYSPDLNEDYCFRLVPYFKRVNVERGSTLWTSGSEPDAFYVIESGMLRANYVFSDRSNSMSESMVAGTVAGELSFLSRTKRNTTVVAERDSVLWKMDIGAHEELGKKEGWQFARRFEEVVLKIAVQETDVLMGHLMTRS
ncbi:hypothetical protein JCM11641_007818 [Rhodosporidiobolus odoratus]